MQLVRTKPFIESSVVTIGNFDGLHLGHQALISKTMELAQSHQLHSVLLSFNPLPRIYFQKTVNPCQLMDFRTKFHTLKSLGFDFLKLLPFNSKTKDWSARYFVEQVLVKSLKAKFVVVGTDFAFGKDREGDIHTLKTLGHEYGFEVKTLPPITYDDVKIGSSFIKTSLQKSDFEKASKLLGRDYSVIGKVVHGQKRGRLLGFPTANILCKVNLPITGVFAVKVSMCGKTLLGVANIGVAPTIRNNEKSIDTDKNKNKDSSQIRAKILEVHLFDFSSDIYGETIEVQFISKLRDEQRFANIDALKFQINNDCEKANQLFEDLGLNHG